MSEWLKLLPLELSEMSESEIIEPRHPTGKSDTLVGEMSDMSKRLFTLAQSLDKAGNQCKLDAQYCPNKTERMELAAKTNEFLSKAETLRTLMWIGIKDEYGLWNAPIGVRIGFKIVTTPTDEDDMPPFLKGFFKIE